MKASSPSAKLKYHCLALRDSVRWLVKHKISSTWYGPSEICVTWFLGYAAAKQQIWISIHGFLFAFFRSFYFFFLDHYERYTWRVIYTLYGLISTGVGDNQIFRYSIFCSIHFWGVISMIFLDMILWHWINWSNFETAYESEKKGRKIAEIFFFWHT